VLIVEDMTAEQETALREELRKLRRSEDEFVYELVVVPSFEDAVVAVLFNFNLQACVIRRRFTRHSRRDLTPLSRFVEITGDEDLMEHSPDERAQMLGDRISTLRPELDLYLMTDVSVEEIAGRLSQHFRRVFHAREGSLELHLSLLGGVRERYRAPFFTALRDYSQKPTGVFHALPISRGKSVVTSHWIPEMIGFYGLNIFLAETSATSGGLDSLLEPTGPLREAQDAAAAAFGARQTFFVTSGTSTANKIVVQALVQPGDIVLVDRNCHQSHHYGLVLSGAHVTYLDAYRLNEYAMYGGVPLREIKRTLLAFRRAGKLDRVKMLMLTNCTFDGIVYDVERVMEECLAIKPDLVFLWDEAWFAFARFHPVYRPRTAMACARSLLQRLRDPGYRGMYTAFALEMSSTNPDDDALLDISLLPDPARTRIRVYATQSTHKTLTSLRQGAMIHVFDRDFSQKAEETFHEAYMAHTSTSPNYQILASLDLGRRQAALEGFELVQKQVEYAMSLRDAVDNHPLLSKYLRFLSTANLIPRQHRQSGIDQPLRSGLTKMAIAWDRDEFVLEPSRATLHIGPTGIDGDTFKHEYLMDRYGLQVNKTSRNTVLFMTNIGTTRSAVAYLIEVLVRQRWQTLDLVERARLLSWHGVGTSQITQSVTVSLGSSIRVVWPDLGLSGWRLRAMFGTSVTVTDRWVVCRRARIGHAAHLVIRSCRQASFEAPFRGDDAAAGLVSSACSLAYIAVTSCRQPPSVRREHRVPEKRKVGGSTPLLTPGDLHFRRSSRVFGRDAISPPLPVGDSSEPLATVGYRMWIARGSCRSSRQSTLRPSPRSCRIVGAGGRGQGWPQAIVMRRAAPLTAAGRPEDWPRRGNGPAPTLPRPVSYSYLRWSARVGPCLFVAVQTLGCTVGCTRPRRLRLSGSGTLPCRRLLPKFLGERFVAAKADHYDKPCRGRLR